MTIPFLINHLWQSSCFALLAGLLAFVLRRNSPKVRYWIWLSASLKFLVPFALLVSLGSVVPRPARHPLTVAAPGFPDALVQIAEPLSSTAPAHTRPHWPPIAIALVWTFGFFAITLSRCRSWLRVRAALRAGTPIDLAIPLPALIAPAAEEPGIVGFLRPVLVLPAQLLERLNPPQLGAILAHELCHVRRRDNLFAAVHMVVEAIFWFHPLVWWIGSRMVEERELACDEEVLRMGCEPVDYVEGILKVCRFYSESPLPCISGVTGADVKKRLRAILEGSIAIELNAARKMILATIALASLTAPILIGIWGAPQSHAQDAPGPAFEVASVKPNKTGLRGGRLNTEPGQLTITNINLRTCIKAAFRLQDYQLSGGNASIEDEPYDIVAKAESPVGDDQLMFMLRRLLADRFKLKFHRESKEMQGYALLVGKNGPNLHEVEAAGKGWSRNGVGSIDGQEVSMARLAEILAGRLGRPVLNLTGINGVFDVKLKWTPDPATVRNPAENKESPSVDSTSDPSGPSIFSALQEQLGLRLEARKVSDEILVIDHLERPSEN